MAKTTTSTQKEKPSSSTQRTTEKEQKSLWERITGGIADLFGGGSDNAKTSGSSGSSGPSSSLRPQPRPAVLTTGLGEDRQYIDTRTGQRYKEPDYGPLSFQGLTSTDPANVLRNREAAARYERLAQSRPPSRDTPQAVDVTVAPEGTATRGALRNSPAAQALDAAVLARIGAPTTPVAPVEVPTPTYGLPSILQTPGVQPVGYGAAFAPGQFFPGPFGQMPTNYGAVNYTDIFGPPIDIFGPQVDLSFMYR